MRLRLILILAAAAVSWAGQSAVTSTGNLTNGSVPNRGTGNPWRLECYIHDWDDAPTGRIAKADYLGADVQFSVGTTIRLNPNNITGGATDVIDIPITGLPGKQLYFRAQYDGALTDHFEVWDRNGVYQTGVKTSTTGTTWVNTGNGMQIGGTSMTRSTAFCRTHSTTVPLNSRPPTTFDNTDRLDEWKLDGGLTNAVRAYDLTGTPSSYVTTTFQNVIAKAQTLTRPVWADQQALRAGWPNLLDGTSSYTQADGTNTVTYEWTHVSTTSNLVWSSKTAAQPVVSGLTFGPYKFRLTVFDGTTYAAADLDTGAVATDINGVVIHANSAANDLFGPMIAFGKNPWGYADESHQRALTYRAAQYLSQASYQTPPPEAVPLAGTVDYEYATLTPRTTTTADVSSSATTISVASISNLDLSSFPTVIGLSLPGNGGEEVLICSNTGLTLNVCYDGRGYNDTTNRISALRASGAQVYQHPIVGTGTQFLTDFCPAGPGIAGTIAFNTGTVAVSPGGSTFTISGGTIPGGVNYNLYMLRVAATHSTGTPFVFFAPIASNTTTTITTSRAYPATADTLTAATFHIILRNQRDFSAKWDRPDGSIGNTLMNTVGCTDNTHMTWDGGVEALVTSVPQLGKTYSWRGTAWYAGFGTGSINYYDEALASYAQYFRSGLQSALNAARAIADYWLEIPIFNAGRNMNPAAPNLSNSRNLSMAGPVVGAVLDGRTNNWDAIRKYAQIGVNNAAAATCNTDDPRESAYQLMWLAYAARHDPDTVSTAAPGGMAWKPYWQSKMASSLARDQACAGADFSFSASFFSGVDSSSYNLQAINGNTNVTGSGIPASMCASSATGTATATNGSDAITILTGTLTAIGGGKLVLIGARAGQPYTVSVQYSGSGSSWTISGIWPGDTGTVTWFSETDELNLQWSENTTLSSSNKGYFIPCRWVSSTQVTLGRGWPGPTGQIYSSRSNVIGFGQQPFFAGIKVYQLYQSYLASSGATATGYLALARSAADWIKNTGYDSATGGLLYAYGNESCTPALAPSNTPSLFTYRNVPCNYSPNDDGKATARALLAEVFSALRVLYEGSPTAPNLAFGDQSYANLWGGNGYVTSGYATSEGGLENDFTYAPSWAAGKWYGFQFGIGFAHQWPAVRVGGVAATDTRTVSMTLALPSGVTAATVTYTAPSSASSVVSCSVASQVATCSLPTDWRQGNYLFQPTYTRSNGSWSGDVLPLKLQ